MIHPAASDNSTQGSDNPSEEPVVTQEEPGNGNPDEPPGTHQGPGGPPENPGNGGPGKDK